MLILLVVTEITEATGSYCSTSNEVYFAHIWVTVLTLFSTTIAIISILKFYKALKATVNHRKPLSKLVAFKGIVFLNFIQNVNHSRSLSSAHEANIISRQSSPFSHHPTISNLANITPSKILVLESPISFSVWKWWSSPYSSYISTVLGNTSSRKAPQQFLLVMADIKEVSLASGRMDRR